MEDAFGGGALNCAAPSAAVRRGVPLPRSACPTAHSATVDRALVRVARRQVGARGGRDATARYQHTHPSPRRPERQVESALQETEWQASVVLGALQYLAVQRGQ